MATKKVLDEDLHRSITSGTSYNHLFPGSSCVSTHISYGSTYFGMDQIKDHIEKYSNQVTRFVKQEIKGITFNKVASTLYNWTYKHFQYAADGFDQDIRSPQCAWASRASGIDCKSFSVFIGSCLREAGYKFYIRKISLDPKKPNQFNHVYIIMPKDQVSGSLNGGYYVIDGTSHTNIEGFYIKKHDLFMDLPYNSLNGAYRSPSLRGLKGPVTPTAVSGFQNFLAYLTGVGVAPETVNGIREAVNSHLSQGIDPAFEITARGVVVGNQGFSFIGTGRSATRLQDPVQYIERQLGINTGRSQSTSGGSDAETAQAIAAVANDIAQSDFFANTFGSIFANGFDLSCWNSSSSPKKANERTQVDLPYIFRQSGITQNINAQTIAKLFYTMEIYRMGYQVLEQPKFASCTQKGGKQGKELTAAFISFTEQKLNAILQAEGKKLASKGTIKKQGPHRLTIQSDMSGGTIALGETLTVKTFEVQTVAGQTTTTNSGFPQDTIQIPTQPTTGNTSTGGGTGFIDNGGGNSGGSGGSGDKENTASIPDAVGYIALAAGAYYFYQESKKKKKAQPAQKQLK